MQLNIAKGMWDKMIQSYEGDTNVKSVKLKTFRIRYETLKMYDDERIATFFLRVDEIVDSMRKLGEGIKDGTIAENIFRSLTPKFDSKVPAIE